MGVSSTRIREKCINLNAYIRKERFFKSQWPKILPYKRKEQFKPKLRIEGIKLWIEANEIENKRKRWSELHQDNNFTYQVVSPPARHFPQGRQHIHLVSLWKSKHSHKLFIEMQNGTTICSSLKYLAKLNTFWYRKVYS